MTAIRVAHAPGPAAMANLPDKIAHAAPPARVMKRPGRHGSRHRAIVHSATTQGLHDFRQIPEALRQSLPTVRIAPPAAMKPAATVERDMAQTVLLRIAAATPNPALRAKIATQHDGLSARRKTCLRASPDAALPTNVLAAPKATAAMPQHRSACS